MKKRVAAFLLLCFVILPLYALKEEDEVVYQELTMQLRLNFTYTYQMPKNLSLQLFQEMRFDLVPFQEGTVFDLSLTSVTLAYKPIPYLKIDGGYMLKIAGAASTEASVTHWDIPNTYVMHRLYGGLTGSYTYRNWQFSLRERFLCDIRLDEIDPRTTRKYALTLRHFAKVSYNIKEKGVTPYLWIELANTLNQTEYCQKDGRQYLERWRSCLGVRYNLPSEGASRGALNFFIRYDQGMFRSARLDAEGDAHISIRRKGEYAIGIGYEI